MKAQEIIADLSDLGPGQDAPGVLLYTRLLLHYLADHVSHARLADGQRLNDSTDFVAWLRELAEAARIPVNTKVLEMAGTGTRPLVRRAPAPQPRWDECPDCGHVHLDDSECGFAIGGGRVCRCVRKVPA